jgi:hypothetical protein
MPNQDEQPVIQVDLTPDPREKQKLTAEAAKHVEPVELSVEKLEERINPGLRLSNHNETFLLD